MCSSKVEGVDGGGTNCLAEEGGFPCRTAAAALITVTHEGMLCGAHVVIGSPLVLSVSIALAIGRKILGIEIAT